MTYPTKEPHSPTLKQQLEQERQRAEQERRLAQWRDAIEETIQAAQASGQFDNLPGKGKPLAHLNDNPYAPGTEIAYQKLKDNDYTLGWISRRNQVQNEIEAFRAELQKGVSHYQAEWRTVNSSDQRQLLIYYWRQQLQTWETTIQALNNKIRAANLTLPLEHLQLITLGLDAELRRVGCGRDLGESLNED